MWWEGEAEATLVQLPDPRIEEMAAGEASAIVAPVEGGLVGSSAWAFGVKRLIDVVGSVFTLILLLPLLCVIALLVKISSPGPVFFLQERVGRDGRPFRIAKFRSMRVGAHEQREDHSSLNVHAGPIFKIPEDPRITPIGRALRRLSLDELPQLWNVLRGDMSLVGPRPPLPEEVALYGSWEAQRLAVKPGITCIWQVSGRSNLDFQTWVDLDIRYIREWSLGLDFVLLLRTIPAVLSGRGAY